MAYADTLTATILARLSPAIVTTEGYIDGTRQANHEVKIGLTDGTGTNQATGFFSSSFTCTTGGITLSLASTDPLAGAGDDAPTMSPAETKLRAILIENTDATNYVSLKKGSNGETSIFSGSTDSIRINAGGLFLWTCPAGIAAMTDGADDELLVTANTASCILKLTYIFG